MTVEKKSARLHNNKIEYDVVDLPGTYSLLSEDEPSRDYILSDDADVIVNVIDAGATSNAICTYDAAAGDGKKVVIALNMVDEVKAARYFV